MTDQSFDPEREPAWPRAGRFTVEASLPAGHFTVRWDDEACAYRFSAEFDGNNLTKVARYRPHGPPVVTVWRKPGGRGATTHEDATSERWAPVITEAAQEIARTGAATEALRLQGERWAALAARTLAGKAKVIREALAEIGIPVPQAFPTDKLAAVYDRIQNSAW